MTDKELIDAFLTGELDEAGMAQLEAELRAHPELVRELADQQQIEQALKVLLGVGEPLSGRIFQHDGLWGETRITSFPSDPQCPVCSSHSRITDLSPYADQVSPRGHVLT